MTRHSVRGYLFIVLAACLWSTIGLFMRALHDGFGFPALTLAFLRAGVAFVFAFVFLALTRRELLRVSRQSILLLMLYGAIGIGAFYFVYAQAIISTSVTTAVVLLYTAPAFVALMAWRAWHEPLNQRKVIAIGLAFAGCALVARAYDPTQLSLNGIGILFGLGAGLSYALFTVLSKAGLKQFSPWTLMVYELGFGALFLLPFQDPATLMRLGQPSMAWLFLLGLALGPTIGAIAAFNLGLRDLPASNVSVVATIEPVVASILAFIILGEQLEFLQLVGGAMVIGGALQLAASN
jgi:DME family drug/metabolite transporter